MGRTPLICVALAVGCVTVRAEEPSKAAVKALARELGEATVGGQYAKVIDQTYPAVVRHLGGREKAIALTEAAVKELEQKGFAIKAYEVGEPGEFHREGDNTFVVVPTRMEVASQVGKIAGKSYLLGISSDGGTSWKFVDGSGIHDPKLRDKLLPKMPAKLKLPETMKPEIVKEK